MKIESQKLLDTIELLKKDNASNCRKTKKDGIMMNWDIDRVKSLVDIYLDNVVRLVGLSSKTEHVSK